MQTCEPNSLSRRDSKFRIISSKVFPTGAPVGLKTQSHCEHPQPRKRGWSIHTNSRGMGALYSERSIRRMSSLTGHIFSPIHFGMTIRFQHLCFTGMLGWFHRVLSILTSVTKIHAGPASGSRCGFINFPRKKARSSWPGFVFAWGSSCQWIDPPYLHIPSTATNIINIRRLALRSFSEYVINLLHDPIRPLNSRRASDSVLGAGWLFPHKPGYAGLLRLPD